jgi:biotin carboxylase
MQAKAKADTGTQNLADDTSKDVVLFINDYFPEYGDAFKKLSKKLNRPLRGIMLIDSTLKGLNQHIPDTEQLFEEIVCDFTSDAELRRVIKRFEDRLLLVSCSSESSQLDFQRVLPHVPYVLGPSEKSLEWATHKGKMRELIGAYNEDLVPKVQPVSSAVEGEIKKVMQELSFPMMVKPTGLSDSSLVAKVHNEQELRQTLHNSFTNIHEVYKKARGNGKPGVIVEEFIEGDVYSIDGYVNDDGKVWLLPLLRSKTGYNMGLEGFYIYQTETYLELTSEQKAAGHQAAEEAIHAVGLRSSVAHVELFHTKDGWKIIELGARPGAMRQEVYQVTYGVDHALNDLLLKVGVEPQINHRPIIHSMVFKIYAEEEGEVRVIEGADEVSQLPSVYSFQMFTKPGEVVRRNVNGGTVMAQGLLFGEQPEQLRKDVAYVRSMITVKTKQPAREKVLAG